MTPDNVADRVRGLARGGPFEALGPFARIALVGLAASTVLALGLAWFIPHRVEERFLQSMAEADQELVSVLVSSAATAAIADLDIERIDTAVQRLIDEQRLVRTKLWSLSGEILYSDEPRLIGRTFTPDEDFEALDQSSWHVSDLSADENELERTLGHERLLETYVTVRDQGKTVGVWEVYRSLDEFDEAIASIRGTVWLSIGVGLLSLAVFLVGGFGALLAAIQRKREEAERRRADVETLLDLARVPAALESPDDIAQSSLDILVQDDRVIWACLSERLESGEERVVMSAGDASRCGPSHGLSEASPSDTEVARNVAAASGQYVLQICQTDATNAIDSALLGAMVSEIAAGVEGARLRRELEANRAHIEFLLERLVDAQEEERRSTVARIHDGLAQDLHRVLFGIRGCLAADEDEARAELRRLEALVSDSSRELRRLLQNIHPSVVDDVGLAASIHSLVDTMASQYDLDVTVDFGTFQEPNHAERIALYRIIREALINAAKHSGSTDVSVSIIGSHGAIEAAVSDTGHGIKRGTSDGIGMWIMRDRAEKYGGTLTVATGESGTTVRVSMPKAVTFDAN